MTTRRRPSLFPLLWLTSALSIGGYFAFAAVQGDHGIFRRIQIEAETGALRVELARLEAERAALENRTRRLSDDYLDLDLLDEQARQRLGLMRPDELVLR